MENINTLDLLSIKELIEGKEKTIENVQVTIKQKNLPFFVDTYQRGYKWGENKSENNLMNITKILGFGNKFWNGMSKFILNIDELKIISTDVWEIANKIKRSKNLNGRDIVIGNKILKYIEDNQINIDEIKLLSNEIEVDIIDIKAIYDRLKLISKNDWTKIFDLGEQTKLFDNLELSNLKSVYKSISKDESIKEINIINALKSVKKLSKFGLHH